MNIPGRILLAAGLVFGLASCSESLTGPSADITLEVASKGRPGGGTATPTNHSVNVRQATEADLAAFAAATFSSVATTQEVTFYAGVDAGATQIEEAAYWGCPDTGKPCWAIDVVLSGYVASDLIHLTAATVNRDPACDGTFTSQDIPIGNSCAHDLRIAENGSSAPPTRRLASLFEQWSATPYVQFDSMTDRGGGRRGFTYLWQGQIGRPKYGSAGGGTVRVFLPDEYDSYSGGGMTPGAFVRFYPIRAGSNAGASANSVDCVFADGQSDCFAPIVTWGASDNPIAQVTFQRKEVVVRSGKGKTQTTSYRYIPGVTTSLEGTADNNWGTMLFETQNGFRTLISTSSTTYVDMYPPELLSGCSRVKLLEVEWFNSTGATADFVLPVDLESAETYFHGPTASFGTCSF